MILINYNLFLPDSDEEENDKTDIQTTIKTLSSKMEDLNTCNDLIGRHGSALQRVLSELEQLDGSPEVASKVKVINERATMFRITSNAMINVGTNVVYNWCLNCFWSVLW